MSGQGEGRTTLFESVLLSLVPGTLEPRLHFIFTVLLGWVCHLPFTMGKLRFKRGYLTSPRSYSLYGVELKCRPRCVFCASLVSLCGFLLLLM